MCWLWNEALWSRRFEQCTLLVFRRMPIVTCTSYDPHHAKLQTSPFFLLGWINLNKYLSPLHCRLKATCTTFSSNIARIILNQKNFTLYWIFRSCFIKFVKTHGMWNTYMYMYILYSTSGFEVQILFRYTDLLTSTVHVYMHISTCMHSHLWHVWGQNIRFYGN